MLSELSPTEVAFLMVAAVQAVAAVVWGLGAWVVRAERPAVCHWSAYATLSSITWIVLATRLESPPLIGIVAGVLAALALQRGIRLFIRYPPSGRVPIVALLLVLVANWTGPLLDLRPFEATVNFGVLAWLFLGMTLDLYRHARDDLGLRWPVLLTLPVLLGGLGFGARALRALADPDSVAREMAADSALNVGSALGYVMLVLSLHASLMALVVARLVRDLQRLSRHDGLTGLLNRRAAQEALDAQVARSLRSGAPFCVLMIDADHFKEINDRLGHAVGDLALKHLAALMRGHMREVDRVGRFGGEEFVVLLPGLSAPAALAVAERLRELVAAVPLCHGATTIALSVSIGIAEWGGAHEETSRLLVRADAALYQAKRHGRDRVAAADVDPLPA
jgi:diguanylate cyclase (GGDEF)-like protein